MLFAVGSSGVHSGRYFLKQRGAEGRIQSHEGQGEPSRMSSDFQHIGGIMNKVPTWCNAL